MKGKQNVKDKEDTWECTKLMQEVRVERKMHSKEVFFKWKVLLSRKTFVFHQYWMPYSSCISLGLNIFSTEKPFLCDKVPISFGGHCNTNNELGNAAQGMDSRGKGGQQWAPAEDQKEYETCGPYLNFSIHKIQVIVSIFLHYDYWDRLSV